MKIKWLKLLGVFIIFYILISIRSNGVSSEALMDYIFEFDNIYAFYFTFTSLFSLFSYSILSYLSLIKIKNKILAWIGVILTFPIAIGLRYFIEEILARLLFGKGNYNESYTISAYFWDNTYFSPVFLALGIAFYFIQRSQYVENQKAQLILEQKQSELSFLKSQINPHFLFNTLNNIYSLVNKNSPNSLIAIEKLSSLLRYSLYESNEKVSLKAEVKMLLNIIELHNLRTKDGLKINHNLNEFEEEYYEIPPLILLPFLENAIKHGAINDGDNPINIKMNLSIDSFNFTIINKIKKQQKDNVGGIGLDNIKKRLNLIYPKSHAFSTEQKNDVFIAKLNIQR